MSRTRTITIAATVLTAVLVPATANAAQAQGPLVQQHYSDDYDVLLPDPNDPNGFFCGGLVNVPLHVEEDGYLSVKEHGADDLAYFAIRFRSTLQYTNPQTGLTFTVVRVHQTKDLRITDNGDGTQTLVGLNTGVLRSYGPDGELLNTRAGRSFDTFLVDTMGTSDPFDDQLTPVGDPDTAGRDTTGGFCEDFLAATNG
jgi:hypothetical protein